MESPRFESDLVRQAVEEHRIVERLIAALVPLTRPERRPSGAEGDTAVFAGLARSLAALRQHLESHFDIEEAGGLFDLFLERIPAIEPAVEALRVEHVEFLDRIDRLLERIDAAGGREGDEIRRDLDGLLRELQEHDDEECRLIHRARSAAGIHPIDGAGSAP